MMIIKRTVRIVLRGILYHFHYKPRKDEIEVDMNGNPLKPGITAVVAAKNEEYTIPLCLRSLLGVVDQIVCIDNGSTDHTMNEIEAFKLRHGDEVEVDIITMPGALLGDCRNAGLEKAKYQWHFRCDADMICKRAGENSMISLREKILKDDTPRAIQLPRTNIEGDFHHKYKDTDIDDIGEPFLIWYNKDVAYSEFGKFDAIRVPMYYKQVKERKSFIFHCIGLKSVDNLLHRFHYFAWREKFNKARNDKERETVQDFATFVENRNRELFGTTLSATVKWRYMRQYAHVFERISEEIEYPDVLEEMIEKGEERFEVIYKNGKPNSRIDKKDTELMDYRPTKEDLEWDIDSFIQKVKDGK